MIDYRSLDTLEVFRENHRVATLTRLPRGCQFRYHPDFLASAELPLALHLPKTPDPLVTEGILNLPTYFAGLLPEGIMLTVAQALIGSARDDLFAVLAATGRDAIGDVEVRVPGAPTQEPSPLNLDNAKEAIEAILDRTGGRVEAIAAISGAQPKMSIGGIVRMSRNARYIAKFPPPDFPGLPENEAACMTLARKCGLLTPKAKVENGIYVVERFDRINLGEGRVGKTHVEDMLQVMNLFPNSKYALDFVEVCQAMEATGVPPAGLLDAIKLYAFSYMVGNGDLHAKNLSLVRKPNGQWIPSPAYDIVSTLPYKNVIVGAEAMALALADESFGRFEMAEFTDFGQRFAIPPKATQKAITTLAKNVQRFAPATLANALPPEDLITILERAAKLLS
jgi:serine/threonine-protein kinase HipA